MSFFFGNGTGGYTSYNGIASTPSEDISVKGTDVEMEIEGVKYKANGSIVVKNGVVYTDGVSQGAHPTLPVSRSYIVQITGKQIGSVTTAGSATVNGDCTSVNAGGSATVTGNVGTLSAGGSANVSGNAGSVSAGGSVKVGSQSGGSSGFGGGSRGWW